MSAPIQECPRWIHGSKVNSASKTMARALEELRAIAAELRKHSENPETIADIDKVATTAKLFERCWSGSWIGYQSRVYHKLFVSHPRAPASASSGD